MASQHPVPHSGNTQLDTLVSADPSAPLEGLRSVEGGPPPRRVHTPPCGTAQRTCSLASSSGADVGAGAMELDAVGLLGWFCRLRSD